MLNWMFLFCILQHLPYQSGLTWPQRHVRWWRKACVKQRPCGTKQCVWCAALCCFCCWCSCPAYATPPSAPQGFWELCAWAHSSLELYSTCFSPHTSKSWKRLKTRCCWPQTSSRLNWQDVECLDLHPPTALQSSSPRDPLNGRNKVDP